MSAFRQLPGAAAAAALGEIPADITLRDLQERAAYAARMAEHHLAAGHKSVARVWENARKRLERELLARLKTEGPGLARLSDVQLLGLSARMRRWLVGLGLIGTGVGLAYMERKASQKRSERAEET